MNKIADIRFLIVNLTDEWSITTTFNITQTTVSYTHLRAHETPEHLVCRLLLEKKNET